MTDKECPPRELLERARQAVMAKVKEIEGPAGLRCDPLLHVDEICRAVIAALQPGDDLGGRVRVMDNKHWLAYRNKSGCVCQLKDDGSDEVMAVCGAHEEWGEQVARQAAEAAREACWESFPIWDEDVVGTPSEVWANGYASAVKDYQAVIRNIPPDKLLKSKP